MDTEQLKIDMIAMAESIAFQGKKMENEIQDLNVQVPDSVLESMVMDLEAMQLAVARMIHKIQRLRGKQ